MCQGGSALRLLPPFPRDPVDPPDPVENSEMADLAERIDTFGLGGRARTILFFFRQPRANRLPLKN